MPVPGCTRQPGHPSCRGDASYLINIASPDPALHRRSVTALQDELTRCRLLEVPYLVLHPAPTQGPALKPVSNWWPGLRQALTVLDDAPVRILLETMAGQGTTVGGSFEDLAWLLIGWQTPIIWGLFRYWATSLLPGMKSRQAKGMPLRWRPLTVRLASIS